MLLLRRVLLPAQERPTCKICLESRDLKAKRVFQARQPPFCSYKACNPVAVRDELPLRPGFHIIRPPLGLENTGHGPWALQSLAITAPHSAVDRRRPRGAKTTQIIQNHIQNSSSAPHPSSKSSKIRPRLDPSLLPSPRGHLDTHRGDLS